MHRVDDDQRPLEERRLERGGAAGDEGDVAGGERLVGAAVDQLDRDLGRVLAADRLDHVAQPRDHRHDEARAGPRPGDLARGAEEARRDVLDLRAAAARQHRDQRLVVADLERGARLGPRRLDRDLVGDRMADVDRVDAVLGVDLGLERKDAEHQVGGLLDLLDPLAAPGPDRRADEVHRLHAGGAQLDLEVEVEVGRVDADEGVGLVLHQPLGQLVADADDLAEVAEHLDVAAHRELVVRPPGLKALLGHPRARRCPRPPGPASARAGPRAAGRRGRRPTPRPRPSRTAEIQDSS